MMAAAPAPLTAARKQIFLGRFISAPEPGPDSCLEIREGAVLVSFAVGRHDHGLDPAGDGQGRKAQVAEARIEKVDWSISPLDPGEARRRLGVGGEGQGEGEVEVLCCNKGGFFFPGFVDTHIHASQYPNTGIFGQSTLLDWLETYTFPLESSFGNPDSPFFTKSKPPPPSPPPPSTTPSPPPPSPLSHARTIYQRLLSRTLSHGTTTASYYATIDVTATNLLATLAHQSGQRALIGRVCMDDPRTCPPYYLDPDTPTSLQHSLACAQHCRALDPTGLRLVPILTPRFAPSCRASTLGALADLAQRETDLRIQTHISETVAEVALVADLFPHAASYAAVYDEAGLLTPRTILAHAIHLSADERRLIAERGAKVAHCPASNSALGSGYCPVRTLLQAGIGVGLGTDVSGGFGVGVLEAVRQAYLVSRTVAYQAQVAGGEGEGEGGEKGDSNSFNIGIVEGLHLATVGGANVVGFPGQMGAFEVGMLWDVQEIELGEGVGDDDGVGGAVDVFGWESWEERVAKWVWSGDDRNVKRVWVGGRLVHERRR